MCNMLVILLFVANSPVIIFYVKLLILCFVHVISSCYLYLEVVTIFYHFVFHYFEVNDLLLETMQVCGEHSHTSD